MRLSLCLAFSHTLTLSLSLFVSRQIGTLRGHKSTVNSAVWSPDGKRIVSASADNLVKIWNAETMAEVSNLCGCGEGGEGSRVFFRAFATGVVLEGV